MTDGRRATFVGTTAIAMWATLALLTAESGRVPPFQLVAMAFGIAAATAATLLLARGRSPLVVLRQPLGAWVLGVGGLFGYHFFYFLALRQAPPLQANLLNYLWPLLIVLFSALLPGERLRRHHIGGGLLGLAGAWILIGGGDVSLATDHAAGYAAALACAVVWAGYSVASRLYQHVPTEAVGGFCAATALLAGLCHLAFETTVWPQDGGEWLAVVGLGLGPVGAAFFVWDHGVKHGDIRALGILSYATPLLSTGLLIVFGRGAMTVTVAVAALLIVGGALLGATDMLRRKA